MANPVYVTYTTTGAKTPINLDYYITPFNVGVGVYLTGTATYAVQYTFDDLSGTATVRWFDDGNLPTGTASSGTTNYAFPITAIRVNIAALTGDLEIKVLQGMSIN